MSEAPSARRARIAAAFEEATAYAEHAAVQRVVADSLAERIAADSLPANPRILELGCGTGFLTRALAARIAPARWTVSDIAPAMVDRARAALDLDADYRVIDGERIDPALGHFDLIAASLAVQWFADLPAAVARLAHHLEPGGLLAFSTMAAGSFGEWREALGPLVAGTPTYPDAAALARLIPAGVTADIEVVDVRQPQTDARGFLRGLKAIGAGTPQAGYRPMAPAALREAMARFDSGPRIITYRIGFCLLRKP